MVEVTLAVAIAALAIITLLGLLPQGLEMARKTALMVNDSNILEQITHDLENAAFDQLPTQTLKKYYNDQAREVQQDATDLAFVVEIEPQQVVALPKAEKTQPYMKPVSYTHLDVYKRQAPSSSMDSRCFPRHRT